MYQTNDYEGMLAETVTLHGAHGDPINAYFARPLGPGPYPGVILIHHLPGWDAVVPGGHAQVRAPRLRGALAEPLLPRGPRDAGGRGSHGARRRGRAG